MQMSLNIVYLSEIQHKVEFYSHNIVFPKVKINKGMKTLWKRFKEEVN